MAVQKDVVAFECGAADSVGRLKRHTAMASGGTDVSIKVNTVHRSWEFIVRAATFHLRVVVKKSP